MEKELFAALKKLNIKFYAYNPLCGGMLSGKHIFDPILAANSQGTRFDESNVTYRNRYWNDCYFKAVEILKNACEKENIELADASIRWLFHHSFLVASRGDGVIIGASSMDHLVKNIASCEGCALPESIVTAFDEAWEITRPVCAKYFRP